MARAPLHVPFEMVEVVQKVRHASRRILQTVNEARAAEEVWRVLATGGDVRRAVAASPVNEAAWLVERALRDAQIVAVTRVLDPPSNRGALRTNRMSFPVCQQLLDLPGVADWFIGDARNWNNPADNSAAVRQRLQRFRERLATLENEEPNKARLVRSFRDENVAHELRFEALPQRPEYRQLHALLEDVKGLVVDLCFIASGEVVIWPAGAARRSATALWNAVATAFPRNIEY